MPKILVESTIPDEDNCTRVIDKNSEFYNAIRTAGDYVRYRGKVYYTFIDFWKDVTGREKARCTNANCPDNGEEYDLQGAHIVLEKPSGSIKEGEECYIVPLCLKCNHPDNKDAMIFRNTMEVPVIVWGKS